MGKVTIFFGTMLQRWQNLWYPFLALVLPAIVSGSSPFENAAIVRSVILGGSTVFVTTTYTVKALESDVQLYQIAFGPDEKRKTSWLEATVKGTLDVLPLTDLGLDSSMYVHLTLDHYFSVTLVPGEHTYLALPLRNLCKKVTT